MARSRRKKGKDFKKVGIFSLVGVVGVLGYLNFANGNLSIPQFEIPKTLDVTSYPLFQNIFGSKNESRVQENIIVENVIEPMQTVSQPERNVKLFFLGRSANKDVYMPVYRKNTTKQTDIEFALKNLLTGPTKDEQAKGIYSEIPQSHLISVKETPNKVVINISSSFSTGGGADSIYKRMYQLIKTVNYNTNKPVYLLLDGQQVEALGGEGLIIKQPLNGSSLDE